MQTYIESGANVPEWVLSYIDLIGGVLEEMVVPGMAQKRVAELQAEGATQIKITDREGAIYEYEEWDIITYLEAIRATNRIRENRYDRRS